MKRFVMVLLLLAGSAPPTRLRAQSVGGAASEILHRLQEASRPRRIIFRCGTEWQDAETARQIASELVSLGGEALPEIERALDSYSVGGDSSEFADSAGWIALAYSQIRGASAALRHKILIQNPRTVRSRTMLCDAMARALGLTFYFDPNSESPAIICRSPTPQDALVLMLFAFEARDAKAFGQNMVPKAGLSAESLARVVWGNDAEQKLNAVGLRLETEDGWIQPLNGLNDFRLHKQSQTADFIAKFSDARGELCGELKMEFVRAGGLGERYLANSDHTAEAFSIISRCASAPK